MLVHTVRVPGVSLHGAYSGDCQRVRHFLHTTQFSTLLNLHRYINRSRFTVKEFLKLSKTTVCAPCLTSKISAETDSFVPLHSG